VTTRRLVRLAIVIGGLIALWLLTGWLLGSPAYFLDRFGR
jgi:hypothetical protein